ncbi:UNVERIFIED_ORG: Mor family transcriptional regulator [Comamonas terrigena]
MQSTGQMAERRHQLLLDMIDVSSAHLTDHVPEDAAKLIAESLADRLADYWGGQLINFPKDYRWKLSQREQKIYSEFNGVNYGALAAKYGMCERGLRKLLARVRDRMQHEHQSAQLSLM